MTEELFREDGYLRSCEAVVTAVNDRGFAVDRTVFYPVGGGQPGDTGSFTGPHGETRIVDCYRDRDTGLHLHVVDKDAGLPEAGDRVTLEINWDRRYRLMRMHSCMHMLCAAVTAPVTGGSIGEGVGRLDFDLPDPPDRQAIEERVNELIRSDVPMTLQWITDEELDVRPDLVRTMSVKPPRGCGLVRLVNFHGVDLQPCGGTHVARSGEIGPVRIQSIKNKGRQNRRITMEFAG